jgi:hypothetical protein
MKAYSGEKSAFLKIEKKITWGTFKTLSQVPIGSCDKSLCEYSDKLLDEQPLKSGSLLDEIL